MLNYGKNMIYLRKVSTWWKVTPWQSSLSKKDINPSLCVHPVPGCRWLIGLWRFWTRCLLMIPIRLELCLLELARWEHTWLITSYAAVKSDSGRPAAVKNTWRNGASAEFIIPSTFQGNAAESINKGLMEECCEKFDMYSIFITTAGNSFSIVL